MKPAPFEYFRPDTVDEALSLLGEHGWEAKLLAGGQSLVPAMNFRLAAPGVLIDLNRIPGLDAIREDGGGTMVRQHAAERSADVRRLAPLLAEALPFVAHPQIRNRGTVGGSVAHADPAAELPAVMLALAARMHLVGPNGPRSLAADEFFTGLFATALEHDEMLAEIEIPALAPRTGSAFLEVSRRHGDFGLAGLAVSVTLDDAGCCADARIALLGVGEGPVLAHAAADALRGQSPSADAFAAAVDAARAEVDPPMDIHASSDYRRHLVGVLVGRALPVAFGRAGGESRV
jgi:CO/xanthine dehydrogenase FAD-binding subunit